MHVVGKSFYSRIITKGNKAMIDAPQLTRHLLEYLASGRPPLAVGGGGVKRPQSMIPEPMSHRTGTGEASRLVLRHHGRFAHGTNL